MRKTAAGIVLIAWASILLSYTVFAQSMPVAPLPGNTVTDGSLSGPTPSAGISKRYSRADHSHGITSAAAGTYSDTAGYATSAGSATTAGYATSAGSTTTSGYATSAGTATTAGYAISAGSATTAGYATSAGSATTAEYATSSGTSTYAISAGSATTAGYATSAGSSTTAGYATSAGTSTYTHSIRHLVRNETGSTIAALRAVYISGFNNVPLVSLATNTDVNKHHVIGITSAAINHEANGYIIAEGLLENVNTDAWTVGDQIYLATGGTLTTVSPTSGEHVFLGEVSVKSATVGVIMMYPARGVDYMAAYSGGNLDIRMGDAAGATKVNFENYADQIKASIDSYGSFSTSGSIYAAGTATVVGDVRSAQNKIGDLGVVTSNFTATFSDSCITRVTVTTAAMTVTIPDWPSTSYSADCWLIITQSTFTARVVTIGAESGTNNNVTSPGGLTSAGDALSNSGPGTVDMFNFRWGLISGKWSIVNVLFDVKL